MNGERYLLDTNAIIQMFKGHQELVSMLNAADSVATSIVCELEFLSYPGLTDDGRSEYETFRSCITVHDLPANSMLERGYILAAREID